MQNTTTLEQYEKEFQLTLSQISHEIRNPLTLINSELQLMAAHHPEVTDYENWDNILSNLEYLNHLLKDLSAYTNAAKLSPLSTEPASYIKKIIASIQPTYDYLGITLFADIPPQLPELFLDQIKMRQAFLNLLRNAREAVSPSNGVVSVSVRFIEAEEPMLIISIKDNGCGIPLEQQETIFKPFVTYKAEGTGLGLAITRQIIEAHGGKISLQESSPEGTEFQIRLMYEMR